MTAHDGRAEAIGDWTQLDTGHQSPPHDVVVGGYNAALKYTHQLSWAGLSRPETCASAVASCRSDANLRFLRKELWCAALLSLRKAVVQPQAGRKASAAARVAEQL